MIMHDSISYDPDTYLASYSIAEVRAIEKRTRVNIELKKKELRSMVGEQYQQLISAADEIITMNTHTQEIRKNLDRMETACDAKKVAEQSEEENKEKPVNEEEAKRRQIFVLASLIKVLTDVPEQIWHALEHNQHLQACQLYTIARAVNRHLESGTIATIDTKTVFPVVQRQWDAIRLLKSHIVEKSKAHLCVTEQNPEHVAELLTGIMLLESHSMEASLELLLETELYNAQIILNETRQRRTTETREQLISEKLCKVALIVKHTLIHIHNIFIPSADNTTVKTLLEANINAIQDNFSFASDTPLAQQVPLIANAFSRSTNAHLLVRHVPVSLQKYSPIINYGPELKTTRIRQMTCKWLEKMEDLLKHHLAEVLKQIESQETLVKIRKSIWSVLTADQQPSSTWQQACHRVLDSPYSVWEHLFRGAFNNHAQLLVKNELDSLAEQPRKRFWPIISNLEAKTGRSLFLTIWPGSHSPFETTASFALPSYSSPKELAVFKSALTKAAQSHTQLLCEIQCCFEDTLANLRSGLETHLTSTSMNVDLFEAKTDAERMKTYFQDQCFQAVSRYAKSLKSLINDLENWADRAAANDVAIFIGRWAGAIAASSKELPRALTLLPAAPGSSSELRSDPRYTQLQGDLMETFHSAHQGWMDAVTTHFAEKVKVALGQAAACNSQRETMSHSGDEEQNMTKGLKATDGMVRVIYDVCKEMQRVNGDILDKVVVRMLREQLWHCAVRETNEMLGEDPVDISEKGAEQLLIDLAFLSKVLTDSVQEPLCQGTERVKQRMDPIRLTALEPRLAEAVDQFFLNHALILAMLARPDGETLRRIRARRT